MRRKPCASHCPTSPRGVSVAQTYGTCHRPYIRIMRQTPSFIYTIISFSRFFSRPAQVADEIHQRTVHFAKVGSFGSPIVFFQIDIGSIVATPRRQYFFIPQTLQVSRNARRTRRRYQQVTSVLEIKCLQLRIMLQAIGIQAQLLIGSQGSYVGSSLSQVQRNTVEKLFIICHVRAAELIVSLCHRLLHPPCHDMLIITSFFHRVFIKAIKTGGIGYQYQGFTAIFNFQFTGRMAFNTRRRSNYFYNGLKVYPSVGVVQMFFFYTAIIHRIRVISRIAFCRNRMIARHCGVRQRRIKRKYGVNAFIRFRLEANNNHRIGSRCKIIGSKQFAATPVSSLRSSITDIQQPLIRSNVCLTVKIING